MWIVVRDADRGAWCSREPAGVDRMALDDVDSDDEKRGSFDDSSDEDLDSAPTIRQQPEPVITDENMDISSTDGLFSGWLAAIHCELTCCVE